MLRALALVSLLCVSPLACACERDSSPVVPTAGPSAGPVPLDPLEQARASLAANAWTEALEWLRIAEASHPADEVAAMRERVVHARWLARGGERDFEWLERQIRQRIVDDPRDVSDWAALARLHVDRAHREGHEADLLHATLLLDQAEQNLGRAAELELVRGLCATVAGDSALAAAAWTRALELDPELDEARLRLGLVRLEVREFRSARALLLTYVERNPNDGEGWLALGVAHTGCGELDQAEAAYQQVIALDPSDLRPHWNLAWMYSHALAPEHDEDDIVRGYDRAGEQLEILFDKAEAHPLPPCEEVLAPDPECLAAVEARAQLLENASALREIGREVTAMPPQIDELERRRLQLLDDAGRAGLDRARRLREMEAEAAEIETEPEPEIPSAEAADR